jgi:hypothetical protein
MRRIRPDRRPFSIAGRKLTAILNRVESPLAARLRLGFSPGPPKVPMLFLLNDVMLSLDPEELSPPVQRRQFEALTMGAVTRLGQELYAAEPLLHLKSPERSMRLAALIIAKQPEVNAALFVAPARGCQPEEVGFRYAALGLGVMGALLERQKSGALTNAEADRQVWRRLAA